MKHILAIDFESWIFSKKINALNLSLDELKQLDNGYTKKTLEYLLGTLKKYNQKTTFFIVTKLEELYPGIIGAIKKEGHEIGWHTHTHREINSKEALLDELSLAEKIIKKYKIKGFQAPSIIFFRDGYRLLKQAGFVYSSSIYGNSQEKYDFDGVIEFPVSTSNENYKPAQNQIVFPANFQLSKIFQYGIPYGSSFFWGLLGKKYYSEKLSKAAREGRICNLFIHDWQLVRPTSKEYKKDTSFFWNPLFLPYKINVAPLFEYLLANFKFRPIGKLLI